MTDEPSNVDQSHHSLTAALDYLQRGFAIVPQRAGEKKPCVRWKPYQQQRPSRDEVTDWLTRQFPDAGLAVILGPVSDLFVIDVDGAEADAELIARLGTEPIAPKVLSGGGKLSRFHLFFRHPPVATHAKFTPWHPKLEFRGDKGIVILPPSLHKSGTRYQWAPGQSLDDIALPDVPAAVFEALSERANRDANLNQQGEKPVFAPDELTQVQARARSYLAKLPAAVEGHGGDKQTFTVACHLILGFGLSPVDALPLLREYNERCQPRWTEDELVRKLQEADKRGGPQGTLIKELGDESAQQENRATKGGGEKDSRISQPFVGSVPNFILADWIFASPRRGAQNIDGQHKVGRPRIGGGFHWAVHHAVIAQRTARVLLPDVLLGQVFWGGEKNRWPANWRQHLLGLFQRYSGGAESPFMEVTLHEKQGEKGCPSVCTLHGSAIPHRHFSILIRTEHDIKEADRLDDEGQPDDDAWFAHVFLGVLELYGFDTTNGERVYDFTLQTQRANLDEENFKALVAKVKRFRNTGRLVSVYLPLRMFGGCPRLGLTYRQRQLLLAVHRELTRDRKSGRPDKAQVIIAGKSAVGAGDNVIDHYPGLMEGRRYVGFNGNGGAKRQQYRGRGYRLLGDKGWLFRARYVFLGEAATAWKEVRSMLKDFQQIGETFGLVVAGRHRQKGEWLGLADLLGQTKTEAGRKWLSQCVLRVYTEEDYVIRWRGVIAERMGFASIPDRDQEKPAVDAPAESPVQLLAYLNKIGISQTELAKQLGMSKSQVSQYMNGKKTWTTSWQDRLKVWIASRERMS